MVYRTNPESQAMATKTVISTNMSAARGISIAIDQDGVSQRGQQIAVGYKQQPPQLDAGKITIYQHSNNKMVTSPTQAAIIRTAGDEEQQQQVSPKSPASSTTFIGLKRHNHNGANKSGELERGRNDRDDNDVEEQRRVSSAETGYTTATFPQMLLKVATSERGKCNSNGNGQVKEGEDYDGDDNDEEKSQMNGKGAWNGAGVSATHGRRESGDANDEADNGVASNMQAAVSNASSVCVRSKRTMIIQCNDADDERADHDVESANCRNHIVHNDDEEQVEHNDDKRCNGNGNHSHSYSYSHSHNHSQSQSSSYVGVGVDDVGENGQNAFDRLAGSGGSGSAGVEDGHRGRQLESVHAAISPNSLTTKADCASALTETVRYADDASHVVKIQINRNAVIANEALEVEKQVTVVTLNDQDRLPIERVVERKPSEIVHSVPKRPEIAVAHTDLSLNIEKMVQKPLPACVSTVTTAATVIPHGRSASVSANASTGSGTGTSSVPLPVSISGNISSGGTTVTELNVSHPSYYYVMSSGQFSPCDTLDSGTGSDLETGNTVNNSLPKAATNGISCGGAPKLELHLKTTKIRVNNAKTAKASEKQHCNGVEHARAGSLTDSEESESSSLSCDSLHSADYVRQSSLSPTAPKPPAAHAKMLNSFLPDSLLRDIRDRKFPTNDFETKYGNGSDAAPPPAAHETVNEQDFAALEHVKFLQERNSNNTSVNTNANANTNKRNSLPGKTFVLNTENGTFVDTKMNSMPRRYEADKYYNFHVNEHENFRSFGNGTSNADDLESLPEYDGKIINDDAFAGYKDIRCGSATSTIRSSKGTVRGVKNRVRNGIATFLQLQQPNVKNYKEKDLGKVVLYTTSMGIIRDTYAKCSNVKQILRTLLVKFEERDVFMSVEYQAEIKERMHSEAIKVPQLFVEGQHIGDADTVERLNESGELRQLLKPYKSISSTYTCQTCGGYRLLPCPSCNGSKKSVHRNHFTAEFVALKCMNCDEVGLVKCHNC